jgi:5'-nucleotidase
MRIRLAAALVAAHAVACAAARPVPAPAPPGPIRLTVFATSDFHGALAPEAVARAEGAPLSVGGAATLGGYLAILREENPGGVIALDAGDLWQGTLAAGQTEGAAVVDAYDALGYDAVAVGNHEFDHGPVGPAVAATAPGQDPTGALEARVAQARFPFLAANVVERATGRRPGWLRASTVIERRGLRIGIVGAATPATPQTTLGTNVAHLEFRPIAPAAIAEATALRAAGADVVLLVVHDGASCAGGDGPCEGPLLDLARALPPGLFDAVIGGHFHRAVEARVGGMPVLEPPAGGKGFGTLDLVVDPGAGKVTVAGTEAAHPACVVVAAATGRCGADAGPGPAVPARYRGREVVPAPPVAAAVAPHLARERELRELPLGARLPVALGRSWDEESPLGDLVTDAIRAAVPEADLAVTNAGGLRADLPAGPLAYGDAYAAIPFENRLAVLTLTGAELRELVRLGASDVPGGLQVSGAVVRVRRDRPGACAAADLDGDGRIGPADRDRIESIEVGGAPLDPARQYRIATNDYLAQGGDGLATLIGRLPPERVRLLPERPLLRDVLIAFVRDRGELSPPPGGRLIVEGAEPKCPPGR